MTTGRMLVTYRYEDEGRAGLLQDGRVFDLAAVTGDPRHADMLQAFADWDSVKTALGRAGQDGGRGRPLSDVRLLAPLPRPNAIYCAGANYADHLAEMQGGADRPAGSMPWHFVKSSHSVVGPGEVVALPPGAKRVDWEAELAVVIGHRAKHLSADEALDCIAGYTIANDLSARDLSRRADQPEGSPFYFDWMAHKSFDGSCPLGPGIVPAEDVGSPHDLGIRLYLNGDIRQDSRTSAMIFDVVAQLVHLSRSLTLWPGDIVLTGTPAGVGAGRGEFLAPGDDVRIEIDKVGCLQHKIGPCEI